MSVLSPEERERSGDYQDLSSPLKSECPKCGVKSWGEYFWCNKCNTGSVKISK